MPSKNYFIQDELENPGNNLVLVHCDFINGLGIRNDQGVTHLTVSAREWDRGQYYLGIMFSLLPDTFLHSQDQPDNMKQHATSIEFNRRAGFDTVGPSIEKGKRFIHSNGAIGLRPYRSDKITFIQHIKDRGRHLDIAGRIHYQAFTEHNVLQRYVEAFRIPLEP